MKIELNKTNQQIPELISGDSNSYDRIFSVFQEDGYYAYNIIKSVNVPDELAPGMTDYIRLNGQMAWTHISFQVYGTIKLWWLICLTNKILNPVILPKPGTVLKIIKPEFLKTLLSQINDQL